MKKERLFTKHWRLVKAKDFDFKYRPASLSRQVILQNRRLCVSDREARADRHRGKLIDGVAPGAPIQELLFVEALGHAGVPFTGFRLITASGSSWPPSTCIVQRKRRP